MTSTETSGETKPERSPYEMMGGEAVVRRVVDRFYDIMDSAPEAARIRAMHQADLAPMRQALFEFLSGWLGGPPLYFQRPGHNCIMSAHRRFAIGEAERDEWMYCIRQAMKECDVPEELRALLDRPFLRMCEAFRNR